MPSTCTLLRGLQDDVITVIRRVDEHWAEGRLADRIGIFPISFVDFNDSAKWLLNNPSQQQLMTSSSSNKLRSNRSVSRSNEELASGSSRDIAVTVGVLITTAASCITTNSSGLMALSNALLQPPSSGAASQQHKRHSLTTFANSAGVTSTSTHQHRHSMVLPVTSQMSPGAATANKPLPGNRYVTSPLVSPGVVMATSEADTSTSSTSASASNSASAGSSSARGKCTLPAM